jgi:hypothetical protein
MRLIWKWVMVSVGGGILLTAGLFFFSVPLTVNLSGPLATVAKVVLWPVTISVYLSGPGPNIGPPEKHWHEWTPVQDFGVATGIGLSWIFYSSLLFVAARLRGRRPAAPPSPG